MREASSVGAAKDRKSATEGRTVPSTQSTPNSMLAGIVHRLGRYCTLHFPTRDPAGRPMQRGNDHFTPRPSPDRAAQLSLLTLLSSFLLVCKAGERRSGKAVKAIKAALGPCTDQASQDGVRGTVKQRHERMARIHVHEARCAWAWRSVGS